MTKPWTIGAQLSTSHSAASSLNPTGMAVVVEEAKRIIDLQIVIIGTREIPEVFRSFTGPTNRVAEQIFLWFDLLSDIPDLQESDLVVNWRGERSRGWGGWAESGNEVEETFRFACPNNPAARRKILGRLRELLSRYAFDGVFIDKMRFPSPANGLDEVASCFCPHCRDLAAKSGLDLDAVAKLFAPGEMAGHGPFGRGAAGPQGKWLATIAAAVPLLARFLRFRSESITRLVAEAHGEAARLNRRVSLDLFSPGLAPLVGQDYRALEPYAVWAKPMTYRTALGPAGLRLEIPALAEGVGRMLGIDEDQVSKWASEHLQGFDRDALTQMRQRAVPLTLITAEITAAVQAMPTIPVYFGLELVRQPGIIEITPSLVNDMVRAGRDAKAAGAIISWDLMHAPADNLHALADAMRT